MDEESGGESRVVKEILDSREGDRVIHAVRTTRSTDRCQSNPYLIHHRPKIIHRRQRVCRAVIRPRTRLNRNRVRLNRTCHASRIEHHVSRNIQSNISSSGVSPSILRRKGQAIGNKCADHAGGSGQVDVGQVARREGSCGVDADDLLDFLAFEIDDCEGVGDSWRFGGRIVLEAGDSEVKVAGGFWAGGGG